MKEKEKNHHITLLKRIDFKGMSTLFKMRDKFHPPIEKVKKAGIKPGDYVLDYGCGPGNFTLAAASLVGSSGIVYAADINPLAIETIKNEILKNKLNNISTILTELNTGLKDHSVDAIICFDMIHQIKDLRNHLKEFHRVMKFNSILSIDDHHLKENDIISKITEFELFKFVEKKEKIFNFIKV